MRIRSIKPEFWRSDDITGLPIEDRLLFIGLWSYVDDNGVGRDKLADICADLFAHDLSVSPHDTLMRVDAGLKRLQTRDLIARYSVENRQFLYVCQWSAHQRINRPSPGRYPSPTSKDAVINEDSVSAHGIDSEPSLPGAGEQWSRGAVEQVKEAPTKSVAASESKSSKPVSIEHSTATAAYERIGKAGNFMALRGIVKWAIHERGEDPVAVEAAIVAIYEMGKPVTKQVMGQFLDGFIGRQQTSGGVTKQDAKVLGYLERGQRLADAARQNTQKEIS